MTGHAAPNARPDTPWTVEVRQDLGRHNFRLARKNEAACAADAARDWQSAIFGGLE